MAIIGGLIAGGAAIYGDMAAQSGVQATNAQSTANMLQNEQWQENMSDTAMQRRVADMKAAGLNPIMAAGGPGASVGSVSQPNLQNPAASMANLGGQVSSAVQTAQQGAQLDLMRAQADKTRMDTAQSAATLPYTGETAKQTLDQIQYKTDQLIASASSLYQQGNLTSINSKIADMSMEQQVQAIKLKTDMAALDVQRAQLGMPKLENDAVWQRAFPKLSGWLQSGAAPAASSVVGTAAKAASMFP